MSVLKIAQMVGNGITKIKTTKAFEVALELKQSLVRSPKSDIFTKYSELQNIPKKLSDFFDNYPKKLDNDQKMYYLSLFKMGEDKFDFITKHDSFGKLFFVGVDEFLETVSKTDMSFIKKTFDEVDEMCSKLPGRPSGNSFRRMDFTSKYTPCGSDYAKMLILKAHQPETFKYLQEYEGDYYTLTKLFTDFSRGCRGTAFKTLTPAQIRQMDYSGIKSKTSLGYNNYDSKRIIYDFIDSSDSVNSSKIKTDELHSYLSNHTILEDITAFRSERDVGMFASIPLDSKMEKKTRFLALRRMLKSNNVDLHEYTGQYEPTSTKTDTLYSRIMNKEHLTLADAMEVAKFGSDKYIQDVTDLIKKAEIIDERFKSLSFDKGMAESWIERKSSDNMKILQSITAKKGLNGVYTGINNNQMEFILDNQPKRFRFTDAIFDRESGIFRIDSVVEGV